MRDIQNARSASNEMGRCKVVTFVASDGFEVTFPLDFLVDRGAIVADRINGEDIRGVMACSNQLWIPGFPAKYFIRDIVKVDFSYADEIPPLPDFINDGRDFTNRPNVSCRADYVGHRGEPMLFQGWADDYDKKIVGIEFSIDGGASWTKHATAGTDAVRWVWWRFEWVPEECGAFQMMVRSVNEDGDTSPIAAVHDFQVL